MPNLQSPFLQQETVLYPMQLDSCGMSFELRGVPGLFHGLFENFYILMQRGRDSDRRGGHRFRIHEF